MKLVKLPGSRIVAGDPEYHLVNPEHVSHVNQLEHHITENGTSVSGETYVHLNNGHGFQTSATMAEVYKAVTGSTMRVK